MKNVILCLLLVACGDSTSAIGDDTGVDAPTGDISDSNQSDSATVDAYVCQANLQLDPDNCGACGRSCLGGSCSSGMCESARMDNGSMTGYGDVHADSLFLYFTAFSTGNNPHRLWRIGIGVVGDPSYLGVLTSPTVSQIGFLGTDFYVVEPNRIIGNDKGNIRRIGKEPLSESTILNFLPSTTTAVTIHNGFIYWATDVDGPNGGDIKKVSTSGGPVSTITISAGTVEYMKTDGTNIYWVGDGQLKKAPLSAGPPVTLGPATSKALDIDGSRVYALNGAQVVSASLAGGGTTVNAGATGMTTGVAVDDDYVYAAKDGNKIVAVPKGGGSPVQMWTEASIDLGGGCFLNYKVTRVKTIDAYLYFSAQVVNSCSNAVQSEGLYRTPRM